MILFTLDIIIFFTAPSRSVTPSKYRGFYTYLYLILRYPLNAFNLKIFFLIGIKLYLENLS